jgi:glycosyltransferase involved in cell wall biosynthesis
MKIGIEVQRLFRKEKYGIETSALQLIKKLQQLDPRNEFVVFAKDDVDRKCFQESANFKIREVAGRLFADFEQIFLPLAAKQEKIELLHCTGNTAPYFSAVPIVQTLHDIIFMDPIPRNDSFYQRFGNFYRRKLVPLVTPRSKMVITVSNYEKDRIISRLGIAEEKIEVIYNGINEQHFRIPYDVKMRDHIRAKYKLPQQFILFLGNTSSRKNALRVIEAYAMYAAKSDKPIPLVTPGLPQSFINSRLNAINLSADCCSVLTPGYISDEDLPYVYNMSTVFLFPSLSEGFGMPIVEAMACGTPVITSKISSMPEIAGDGAFLIDPFSAPSIADGLLMLLNNEDLRNEKIQDGIINSKRFSWTLTAEKIMSVYERVLHPQAETATSTHVFSNA